MFGRIPMCLRVLGGTVVLMAVLATAGCDDSAKLKELQDKTAALEARVKELEEKQAAPTVHQTKPDKDDEFVIATAAAALEALLAGDASGLRGNVSTKLMQAIDAEAPVDFLSQQKVDPVKTWIGKWNNKQYKSYTVEKVIYSPTKDQVVVQGTLIPKVESNPKGSFSITLVKEKDNPKYVIDACSGKP